MKNKPLSLILLTMLTLTACAAPGTAISPTDVPTTVPVVVPTDVPVTEPTPIAVDLIPAQLKALEQLAAALNLPVDQIELVSTTAVDWPDGCLGVALPGVMCTQAIVPGFQIILSANGTTYDYHTNQDGTVVVDAAVALGSGQVSVFVPDGSLQNVDVTLDRPTTGMLSNGGAAGGNVYALNFTNNVPTVVEFSPNGPRTIDFIVNPSYGLAVWDTGETPLLAWATAATIEGSATELHLATPDGSRNEVVVSEVMDTTAPYQFVAHSFTADGTGLYFSREPYGIGGYIPFAAASSLYRYNFSDQTVTEIVPFDGGLGRFLCVDDLSDDGNWLVDHCNGAITVTDLSTDAATTLALPADVDEGTLVGTGRLNPDNTQVAYALALGNPDGEQGWVALSNGLEGDSTVIVTSEPGSYYTVVGWLDSSTLLLQLNSITNCNPTCPNALYTVGTDGSSLTKIADGTFVTFVSAQ